MQSENKQQESQEKKSQQNRQPEKLVPAPSNLPNDQSPKLSPEDVKKILDMVNKTQRH